MVGRSCYYIEDYTGPYGITYGFRRTIVRWSGGESTEIGVHEDPLDELAWAVTRFTRAVERIASLPDPRAKRRKTPLWPPGPLPRPKATAKPSETPSWRPGRARRPKRAGLGLRNFRKVA